MHAKKTTLATALVTAAGLLLTSPATAAEERGSWNYQGKDVFTKESRVFPSGGGDFKICLSSGSKYGSYRLMEYDPVGPDDIVSADGTGIDPYFPNDFDVNTNCLVYHDIGDEVDGAQAEFYLTKWSGGNSTVYAYD
jgi:hypothetical protein